MVIGSYQTRICTDSGQIGFSWVMIQNASMAISLCLGTNPPQTPVVQYINLN